VKRIVLAAALFAALALPAPAQEAPLPDQPAGAASPGVPGSEAPEARGPRPPRAPRASRGGAAQPAGSIEVEMRGGVKVRVQCPDREPFAVCLDAVNALLDRAGPGGPPAN